MLKPFAEQLYPIVGVIYQPPSLGHAGHLGMQASWEQVRADIQALVQAGVDGILLENESDRPHSLLAPPHVVAGMTWLLEQAAQLFERQRLGIEFLLNDPLASLGMAQVCGAGFIRTDYFVDHMQRPEYGGAIAIDPAHFQQQRQLWGAQGVSVLADIQVKYAQMIKPRSLKESAREAFEFGADAVVVTGTQTGVAPQRRDLELARLGPGCPVWIGSGLDVDSLGELAPCSDGAIVGTALMDGRGRISPERSKRFMQEVCKWRQNQ